MVRVLLVCVCLFSLVGCGTSGNPARSDCEDFVENQYCPTLLACGAPNYSSVGDCIGFFESSGNTVLDCDTVTVEYGGLGACEAQVNGSYCDELVSGSGYAELPAVCAGVFN